MINIDVTKRSPILLFKRYLYQYMKKNNLRYSEQRERVLKTLHELSTPITAEALMETINRDDYSVISYTTTLRHIGFYKKSGWIIVVNKVHKQYILVRDAFPIK